jgi:molybdopterin synthase catalytic subunit
VKVSVRCFAAVRELFGREVLEVELAPGATVADLKAQLNETAAGLDRLTFACAVNRAYADARTRLADGDEVAFIPPISGGGSELFRFGLTGEPLDPRVLEAEVRTDRVGAIVTFAGVTRDHNEGDAVQGLSYEAYEEMASRLMVQVFEQAHAQFSITRARVVHRLGDVPVGEASILVVVSAEHRGPAFEACRFIMDRVKASVPIFKRERLAGREGGSRWLGDLPAEQDAV